MSITDKLDSFMKANGYSKADFARLSEIPYTTIDGLYKRGDSNTRLPTLKKLAKFMGCTLDELADVQTVHIAINVNSYEERILSKFRLLSEDDQDDIEAMIDAKLARRERKYKKDEESCG